MSDNNTASSLPPRRTVRSKRKSDNNGLGFIIIIGIIVIAIGIILGLLFSASLFDKKTEPVRGKTSRLKQQELLVAKDKAMILILGVDTREDDVGRSDTIMVAAVDPKKKQAALLSIPRDTRVHISRRYGYDKINAAYPYGGLSLSRSVVEDFLGTPMDHYIMVDTRSFKRVIDAIGGIDLDVEKRMAYEDPWDGDGGLVIDLYPGMQHLDGKKAIGYVRYRDEDGDIGRISRQQKFMRAVMDKVTSPAIIADIPKIVGIAYDSIKTDLSIRQIVELAGALKEAQANGLKSEMIPGEPYDDPVNGVNYWIPSISLTRQLVTQVLDIGMTEAARRAMEKDVSEYNASLPSSIRSGVSVDDEDERRIKKAATEKIDKKNPRQSEKTDGGKKADEKKPGQSIEKTKAPSAPERRPETTGREALPQNSVPPKKSPTSPAAPATPSPLSPSTAPRRLAPSNVPSPTDSGKAR